MKEEITSTELMEFYIDTLERCGMYLLNEEDEIIGYNIFEQFDCGACSYLHKKSLSILNDDGLISNEIMEKSSELRRMFMELQGSDKWNLEAVKSSPEWRCILELSDEIKSLLKDYYA